MCQIESETSLPRATDKAEEGPKWPQKQSQNIKLDKFSFGGGTYARSHVLGRTSSILLLQGLRPCVVSKCDSTNPVSADYTSVLQGCMYGKLEMLNWPEQPEQARMRSLICE